jgi:hypothetical protein
LIKEDIKVKLTQAFGAERRPVAESLGCHEIGFSLPKADLYDPATAVVGCLTRASLYHPFDPAARAEFKDFVKATFPKIAKMFECYVPRDYDMSREYWLANSNYSELRKEELRAEPVWLSMGHDTCDGFIKDEAYVDMKSARNIFARRDGWKVRFGPVFKALETYFLKKLPCFVKIIALSERAQLIVDRLCVAGMMFLETDYSKFESTFDEFFLELELSCWMELLKDHPIRFEFEANFREIIASPNTVRYKYALVRGLTARMSGEMNTSIGNGLMNMLMYLFIMHKAGVEWQVAIWRAFFEGDDGLSATTPDHLPDFELWNSLGCKITPKLSNSISETDFCSQVFTESSYDTLADPLKILANFGWSSAKYVGARTGRKLELLRAKSLSFLWQYPNCPIVASLARYGLAVTSHVDMERFFLKERKVSHYDMEWYKMAYDSLKVKLPTTNITDASRILVMERFGVSCDEQIRVEQYLDNLAQRGELVPLDTQLAYTVPTSWVKYNLAYVGTIGDAPYHDNLSQFVEVTVSTM